MAHLAECSEVQNLNKHSVFQSIGILYMPMYLNCHVFYSESFLLENNWNLGFFPVKIENHLYSLSWPSAGLFLAI